MTDGIVILTWIPPAVIAIGLGILIVLLVLNRLRWAAQERMNPAVHAILHSEALRAFLWSADWLGIKPSGSVPGVYLKPGPYWVEGGVKLIGQYRWRSIFTWVVWDRVYVIDDPEILFPNLVHEMVHCHRRRSGLPSNEVQSEHAEADAALTLIGDKP